MREADEDGLLALTAYPPAEAAEAVRELATGGTPVVAKPSPSRLAFPPIPSPIRTRNAASASSRAWSSSIPSHRQLVMRDFNEPARVAGSAGTGKTVVALHRTVHLARTMPEIRILLATFSEPLAHALRANIRRLIGNEPRLLECVEVHFMSSLGVRLHQAQIGPVKLASRTDVDVLLRDPSKSVGDHSFSALLLRAEWDQVVDAWQLQTWDAYRDVQRLGRRTRLPEGRRAVIWSIYERVLVDLAEQGLMIEAAVQSLAGSQARQSTHTLDATVIDEPQDIGISQLRFLAALGGGRPNGLFFSGDPGQRIFQQPFSWKALGVDVRRRSKTLRVNSRTSHQIREQAGPVARSGGR